MEYLGSVALSDVEQYTAKNTKAAMFFARSSILKLRNSKKDLRKSSILMRSVKLLYSKFPVTVTFAQNSEDMSWMDWIPMAFKDSSYSKNHKELLALQEMAKSIE